MREDQRPGTIEPCLCCGCDAKDCICPRCPHCGDRGNPTCYGDSGMQYSSEQLVGQARLCIVELHHVIASVARYIHVAEMGQRIHAAKMERYIRSLEHHTTTTQEVATESDRHECRVCGCWSYVTGQGCSVCDADVNG